MSRVDPTRTLASMDRAERNIRFGVARGLTRTAQEAAAAVKGSMAQKFDRPTPFTQNAAAFLPAKRESLTALVFVKDVQAGYLRLEETGGVRVPEPGKPINQPVGQRVNAFGNIPRGAIGRIRDRPDVFVAAGRGGAAHLPPGIYQRPKKGARRKAAERPPGLKLLVAFERRAEYEPRFGFRTTVLESARRNVGANIRRSVAEALGSMRR